MTRAPNRLRDFVGQHFEVEGVLQHVGLRTWDLLLVDVDGAWTREEVHSPEQAEALCAELAIRLNRGWDDPRLARRMARRDEWSTPGGHPRGQ